MRTLQTALQFWAKSWLAAKAVACGSVLLSAILFLGGTCRTEGAVVNASACSLSAVQTACAFASPGDTVMIPAGTATWTNTLTITKDIQLIGAGIGQTVISNGMTGTLISWNTVSNGACRLSGFDFEYGPADAINTWGTTRLIGIGGTCHAFRLDNCLFNGINEYNLWFSGWVYGVIDHCVFNAGSSSLLQIQMESYGGQQYGDGSWADADYWGTTNALYIESCTFTGALGQHIGMLDGDKGQRVVVRYCNSTNCPIGSHGTDSGGRDRSVRSYEIYNNQFVYQTNNYPAWGSAVYMRGGTALVWSNTIWGGYQSVVGLADYRYIPVRWAPFGEVTGVDSWDSNNPTLFDSGNATGTNHSPVLVDATKNWIPNQWVNTTAPYVLYDVSQGIGAVITANTANSITVAGSFQGYTGNNSLGYMAFANGDQYQIRQVWATLDQPGLGQGDLITNDPPVNSTTGTAAWPHEVADPVYVWGNNYTFALPTGSYPTTLVGGNPANYVIGTPKPSYMPLVYPHPLVVGTTNALTSSLNTYSLAVNGGTGGGNYAAGTVVPIAAAVVSGQTFTNWTGNVASLVSTVAVSTALIMPANAVTVTANYVTASSSQTNSTGSSFGNTNGPIAQWTLAGDVNDHIGANNGVAYGSPTYVAGPSGAANSAIGLDGASQYILTATLGSFGNNCSSGFTLTAWVKSGYTSGVEAIFGSQGGSGMSISLYLNYASGPGAGRIEGIVRDGANSLHACDVIANSGVTDGNWHFVAWVDNPAANSGTIYLDGVALGTVMSGSAAGSTTGLLNRMGLGIRAGLNDGLFNGALADCRVYNRTLSATDIGTLYANGAAGSVVTNPALVVPPSQLQAHPPGYQ